MNWIKGTVKDIKAWIRKETDGMLSQSEAHEEFFKDVEDHRLSHLVVKKDKPEELKDQEGTWFDYDEMKIKNAAESRFKKIESNDVGKALSQVFSPATPTVIKNAETLRQNPSPGQVSMHPWMEPLGKGESIESGVMEVPDDFGKRKPVDKTEKAKGGNWKPTNPKDLMGIRKVSFCCIPFTVLGEMALGMQEGGMKYGRHNYRDEGVATSTYIDAVFRHITDYWEGEDIDPESGVHHLSKAMSTLCVLRDAQLNDKCTDDRPIRPLNPNWLKELNAKASKLVDKYPQPEVPYTHKPLPRRK